MILPLLSTALTLQTGGKMPQVAIKTLPPVEAPGTKGWGRAGITPEALAARADARMARMKNTIAEWIATINLPEGNGKGFGRSVFYAPGRFDIEVLKIDRREPEAVKKLIWRASNGRTRVLLDTGFQTRANYKALPNPLAPAFLLGFDDVLMRGSQGARSVATLVNSAKKSGFTSIVERRKYPRSSELRLLLTKGATRYAISWNEARMLPSQIYVQSAGSKGKPVRIIWSCAWGVKGSPLTAADVKGFHPASDRRF